MTSAFRDTLFAYILRSAFGSRVFPHADEKHLPTIWQEKLSRQTSPSDSAQTTLNNELKPDGASNFSGSTAFVVCADAPEKVDAENGNDTLLVEWYGPTDPDVSYHFVMLEPGLLTGIVITSESAELVEREESMGDVSDMSSDIHHLRRSCHLHCWNPVHNIRIPRGHCRSDSRSHTLHRRLRNWCVIFSIFFNFFWFI